MDGLTDAFGRRSRARWESRTEQRTFPSMNMHGVNMQRTRGILRSFISETLVPGAPNVRIEDDTSFLDTGLIDSTGVLELVDFLEEQFNIEVEDSELVPENLDSINNLCRYLESKGISDSD